MAYLQHINGNRALKQSEAQDPVKRVQHFGKLRGADTPHTLARLIGMDVRPMTRFLETGIFSEYRFAEMTVTKLQLHGDERRDFFLKTGWLADNAHVAQALREKEVPLSEAIKSLCAISGRTRQQVATDIGVKPTTFNCWVNSKITNLPSRKDMVKMAGEKGFGLTRDQAVAFFEAAGYYYDKQHLADRLAEKNLPMREVLGALMEIDAGSIKDYAKKINAQEATVYSWIKNNTSRKNILPLLEGMSREGQERVMESAHHYLDVAHVMEKLKDTRDHSLLIIALKNVYELTDDDFAVHGGTLRNHRNGSKPPGIKSLAAIFTGLERDHPGITGHWETYKKICARHLGHKDGSHASDIVLQQMDNERNGQLAAMGLGGEAQRSA